MRNSSIAILAFLSTACPAETPDFAEDRAALVREIRTMVSDVSSHTGHPEISPRVYDAMETVPRHEFVPRSVRNEAYENHPLPIGEGQTISQPFIVALMTDLADIGADATVLEIGTGSGYQAAVLAELAAEVYTIEIIESLGTRARETLQRLGYENVHVRIGDGYQGWPAHAPFDAILVTAAPETVPQPLLDQLAAGGKLVVPVGPEGGTQSLQVIEKKPDGSVFRKDTLPVRFVPFTRN